MSVDKDLWMVRAAMCEFLAFSLRYPTDELAVALASGEWQGAAREICAALGVEAPENYLVDLPCAKEGSIAEKRVEKLLRELRPEATYLFVGAPTPACSPYEGICRAEADGVQALMFVNPRSVEVERFCHACGLGSPANTNEPLDHIATELELLEVLSLRAAGATGQAEGEGWIVPEIDLPGGSASAAYDLFVSEHLSAWAPEFAERLLVEARIPFYRCVAALMSSFASVRI